VSTTQWLSTRSINSLAFIVSIGLLCASLYFQFGMKLVPCPMCIFERITMFVLMVSLGVLAFHHPQGKLHRIYNGWILLVALIGAGICIRHVWLQQLPPELVPACGPDLSYMLETDSLFNVIRRVVQGSGDCAEVKWSWLGWSMPAWVLVCFTLYSIWSVIQLIQPRPVEKWIHPLLKK
jgi:disulfide bond formation protein DsbB